MITHDELLSLWEKDSNIDKHKLDDESLTVPKLHHKYLSLYLEIKSKKIALNHRLEELRRDKELYYSGQATSDVYKDKPFDLKLKTKSGVEKHVNTDPEVNKILQRIEYMDVLLEGVNHVLEQIKWRSSSIRNAIDYMRFTSGGL
jgi:hypothetical protein